MLKIVICEDNQQFLQLYKMIVKNYIKLHSDEEIELGLATSSPTMVEKYIENLPVTVEALYLLDIEFADSELRGINVATKVREREPNAKIVFVTSHKELTPLTFRRKVEPLDYIDKGDGSRYIQDAIYKDIDTTISRNKKLEQAALPTFTYNLASKQYTLSLDEIDFFEASNDSHKVFLHSQNEVTEFRGNLISIETNYPTFYRAHKSILVNTSNISSIDSALRLVTFKDGNNCEISRRRIGLLRRKLQSRH